MKSEKRIDFTDGTGVKTPRSRYQKKPGWKNCTIRKIHMIKD